MSGEGQPASILVVGADGMIGRTLADRLAAEGQSVLRTTLLPEPGAEALDLTREAARWHPPRPVSVAYLCAAMPSLDYCRSHPAESRAVNVEGTVTLAAVLGRLGALCVFPSTNLVFEGSQTCEKADAPTRPQTEYGRQKAEAERRLQELPGRVCVVRFTKVLAPAAPLLRRWIESLRQGQRIHPFSDMVMAPVSLDFAVKVLQRVGALRLEGVVQASATADVTYAEAARRLARRIGARDDLVQPLSAHESGLTFEHIPIHTALDASRLSDLGMSPPNPWEAIDAAV